MRWLIEEWHKAIRIKAIGVFSLLCILFNIILIVVLSGGHQEWNEKLSSADILTGEAIYKDIDSKYLGIAYYDERYAEVNFLDQMMQKKYERFQKAINNLAEAGADVSSYAGEFTHQIHEFLFKILSKVILIEGVIIIAMILLYLFYMEKINRTEDVLFSTKRGKNIAWDKTLASLLMGILLSVLIGTISYAAFFKVWKFDMIWGENVSSSNNYIIDPEDPIYNKPFMTWKVFTVKEYFIAAIVLMIVLLVTWWLICTIVILWSKNIVFSLVIIGGCLIVPFFGLFLLNNHPMLYCINSFSLMSLIFYNHLWFTDMGEHAILPWQEILAICGHLVILIPALLKSLSRFKRSDLQ